MVVLFLISSGTSILFSIVCLFTFINSAQVSFLSSSLIILVISCLFDNSPPNRYGVITHCGFDLHFPDGEWWCVSFHVSVEHL